MPPKLDKDSPTAAARFSIAASESLLQRIDEWRAEQRPIPNKSEAARALIELALDVIKSRPELVAEFERRRQAEKSK